MISVPWQCGQCRTCRIMTSLDSGKGCSDSRTPKEHSRPTPLKHLRRLCNRATSGLSCDGYVQGCWELDSGDIDIFPLRSRLRPRYAVGEAIDGNLRNNDAEAQR